MNTLSTKKTKDKVSTNIKSNLIRLGSSLMLPISIIPFAALLLGIATFFPSHSVFGNLLSSVAYIPIRLLPLLFALSIVNTWTNESGKAVFNTLILFMGSYVFGVYFASEFFWYQETQIAFFNSTFKGFFVAFIAIQLHKQTTSPSLFLVASVFLGAFEALLFWPIVIALESVGESMAYMPASTNMFMYGFLNRLLLPFGMHTVLFPPVLYGPIGGTLEIYSTSGQLVDVVYGNSNIWRIVIEEGINFEEIYDTGLVEANGLVYSFALNSNLGGYVQGFMPIMYFGFPAAGYAMYRSIDDKKIGKLVILASFTPLLTGVTEPFEFIFAFTTPIMYFTHSLFTGLSFMLMDLSGASIGMSTGWILDPFLFGVAADVRGMSANTWVLFAIGPLIGAMYYLSFSRIDWNNKVNVKGYNYSS